jgi:hypothetical protein
VFIKECLEQDAGLNYAYYDHVINFADTFDTDKLIDLYTKVNHCDPDSTQVDHMIKNNKLNLLTIEKNHACNIAAMIIAEEANLHVLEKNRLWSLPEMYGTVDINQLHDSIKNKIRSENYQKE